MFCCTTKLALGDVTTKRVSSAVAGETYFFIKRGLARMDSKLVLVADGDERMRNLIQVTLKAHDYKCIATAGGESAVHSQGRPESS